MGNTKITIEALIAADSKKVWDFWTKPESITQWNFSSDDWHCPNASNDLRVGGKYMARMEAKDGSFGFDFEAIYDQVVNQKALSYTLTDGRKVTTAFEALGDKTKVVTVFEAETQNSEEMQKDGWQAILNNFKSYAETH